MDTVICVVYCTDTVISIVQDEEQQSVNAALLIYCTWRHSNQKTRDDTVISIVRCTVTLISAVYWTDNVMSTI